MGYLILLPGIALGVFFAIPFTDYWQGIVISAMTSMSTTHFLLWLGKEWKR